MNTFRFTDVLIKNIKDRGNLVTATVVDRQSYHTPNGELKSRFVCARQITVSDPDIVAFIRKNLLEESEGYYVNLAGYMASNFSQKNNAWYDNQVVTELEVVQQ